MGGRPVVAGVSESASDVDEQRRYDVFVSYNRAEGPAVERIAHRLRDRASRCSSIGGR